MNFCHCGHPIHDAYCTEYVSAAIAYRVVPDFIGDSEEYIGDTVQRFPCQCVRRNGKIPKCTFDNCHCQKNKEVLIF